MAPAKKLKVGLVINRSKAGAHGILQRLRAALPNFPEITLLYEKRTAEMLDQEGLSEVELAAQSDLLIVAGGDGSLLEVVEAVFPSQTPLLGINIGSLGFLTAVSAEEADSVFPFIVRRELRLSPRLALEITHHQRGGERKVIPCALNDLVISRASISRLIRIRVEVGPDLVTEYVCDGLIIATPTGSTAYSLASGGPIMTPDSSSIVITPICPHTLTNRALVVGTDQVFKLEIRPQVGVPAPVIQIDGQGVGRLRRDEYLEIRPAQARVPLAYLPHTDFFRVLRQKLKWSGSTY